ncbi:hypothetical protein J6590_087183 [Homalodisca vitripennis]|nr:hypothetical protein J6590_087183 [Homalodisca vitripennis]
MKRLFKDGCSNKDRLWSTVGPQPHFRTACSLHKTLQCTTELKPKDRKPFFRSQTPPVGAQFALFLPFTAPVTYVAVFLLFVVPHI